MDAVKTAKESYSLTNLALLEAESIFIMREVAAEFENPVMLYSVGKDSSVMVRLAQKAFHPGKIPFPLLHVDTGYKFKEMYEFRDRFCKEIGVELIVHQSEEGKAMGMNPWEFGTEKCCSVLKTDNLKNALKKYGFDAAFGGARRDEEKSRAKERVFSFRNKDGQWDPKNQRPELWTLFNSKLNRSQGENIRVFPLSNWTELDVWTYIRKEDIPVVPMYFARTRKVIVRGEMLIPLELDLPLGKDEKPEEVLCRFRSLGCSPCSGAVRSSAASLDEIIEEMKIARISERNTRIIDFDVEGSMEQKKRDGYF